jgi:CubicO group peptidase (beta-lactamase class C family)
MPDPSPRQPEPVVSISRPGLTGPAIMPCKEKPMRRAFQIREVIRSRLRPAILVLSAAVFAGCAAPPAKPPGAARGDYDYTRQYVSWLIAKEMRRHDVQGLSIALVDDQNLVWAQGFGHADVANRVPAGPDTVYRVGSISKLFTDTAVMQLAEQGRIDIDRPLQTYLREFSIKSRDPQAAPITPRTLMTHHAGLPADRLQGFWSDVPFTRVVEYMKDEYTAAPPNTVSSYSNDGITLLGHMLQEVSGRDFVSQLDDALLRPLGMEHASFALRPDIRPRLAQGYKDGEPAKLEGLRDLPAGNLYASVADLSRFMQMVFADGRAGDKWIVQPETLNEMLRPQNTEVPLDLGLRIGLGWGLGGHGLDYGGRVASHAGATLIFHSQLIILPDHKLGVVVLANTAGAGPVVERIAVKTLKLALEAKTGIHPPAAPTAPPSAVALPEAARGDYAGTYVTEFGLVTVSDDHDQLRAEVLGKSLRLVPRSDGWFGLQYRLLGFIPVSLGELDRVQIARRQVAGHEILAARYQGRELLVGEKIEPQPIPAAWRRRLGSYTVVNAAADDIRVEAVRLREQHGFLILEYRLPDYAKQTVRIALAAVSDREAVILGLGRGTGGTIRVIDVAGEERALVSGFEARRVTE